jgi:hypothetical protein
MKEVILDKSDNIHSLNNKKFSLKTKINIMIASLMFFGLLATITLLIFNNKNIMNFSSNSANRLLKEEDDYSFVTEYITESEDQTIELIYSKFKNIISKLIIDGEEKEPCTSYNFKSKGIHRVYFTLNLTGVTSFEKMFLNNKNLTSITFSPSFNTENITNFLYCFSTCDKLQSVDLSHFNFRSAVRFTHFFSYDKSLKTIDLSNIYAENLTDMSATFYGSSSLTFINLTNFNAPKLWQMIHTFRECTSLTSIDFTNFRAPKLMTLQNAFYKSSSLKSVNLSSVESDDFRTLLDTFYDCHSIEYIYLPKTTYKNGASFSTTFANCYSLTSIDLSNYRGRNIDGRAFEGCTNLSYIDISSFDSVSTNLFRDLPKEGEIKLNKKAYNDIKDLIPEDWTIILIK